MVSVFMYLLFSVYTDGGIAIFFDKMWVALTRAGCCVVAFGGSLVALKRAGWLQHQRALEVTSLLSLIHI